VALGRAIRCSCGFSNYFDLRTTKYYNFVGFSVSNIVNPLEAL
jgi:hypothetical protein